MLSPFDYGTIALAHPVTRKLMEKIEFVHGGKDYDSKYPEGIPTSISIKTKSAPEALDSGLVMFPGGHARSQSVNLNEVLQHKFLLLGKIGLKK